MFLVAKGFDSPMVEQFVNAIVASLLVGIDLLLANFYQRKEVAKAVDETALRMAHAEYSAPSHHDDRW